MKYFQLSSTKLILPTLVLMLFIFTSRVFYGQSDSEWLVEMNTTDGTFQPVGPPLEGVELVYVNVQCKDETNGQYIFVQFPPTSFISVDISNGEIIDSTAYPDGGLLSSIWGIHCLGNCDTLLVVRVDQNTENHYVALFDRFNGTEFIQYGDSLPDDLPGDFMISQMQDAYDPINNLLYLYSYSGSALYVMDVAQGEWIESYSLSADLYNIGFDEVNTKLYGLKPLGAGYLQLHVFDPDLGDFTSIGEGFSTIGQGHTVTTIDGNNERMILTLSSSFYGSFMTSIDLITGELLADIQTLPGDNEGFFGGSNTVNGQYFNSTNQLITLHWGPGTNLSTNNHSGSTDSRVKMSPNPNQGEFKISIDVPNSRFYDLEVVNYSGQLVYKKKGLQEGQAIDLQLTPGYYIANVFIADVNLLERVPFIVSLGK